MSISCEAGDVVFMVHPMYDYTTVLILLFGWFGHQYYCKVLWANVDELILESRP